MPVSELEFDDELVNDNVFVGTGTLPSNLSVIRLSDPDILEELREIVSRIPEDATDHDDEWGDWESELSGAICTAGDVIKEDRAKLTRTNAINPELLGLMFQLQTRMGTNGMTMCPQCVKCPIFFSEKRCVRCGCKNPYH